MHQFPERVPKYVRVIPVVEPELELIHQFHEVHFICPSHLRNPSAKEHFEEFKMQQLEQRRREFELKLSEIEQKVQERSNQLLSDSKEITKAAVEASGKFESYQKTLTWVFIGLAIFGLLFAGIEIWQGSKSLKIEGPIITIEATPTLEPPTVTPIPEPDHPMSTEEREPTS